VRDVTIAATKAGQTTQSKTLHDVITRPAVEELAYDEDGNLQHDSLWEYQWDAENRLVHMRTRSDWTDLGWSPTPNRTELWFSYDYLGRRISKKVEKVTATGVVTTYQKFIYDGWNLIAELDVLPATPKIVRTYAWGLGVDGGSGGVGGLILETLHTDTTLTPYHVGYDGNGNVTTLAQCKTRGDPADGKLAAVYEYGPFGERVRAQHPDAALETAGQPFQFSTYYTDVETGLIYYGHRYYDPSLGRFISRDPIGVAGGENLYAFVDNCPANRWDYLGMSGTENYDYRVTVTINGVTYGKMDPDDLNRLETMAIYTGTLVGGSDRKPMIGFDGDGNSILKQPFDINLTVETTYDLGESPRDSSQMDPYLAEMLGISGLNRQREREARIRDWRDSHQPEPVLRGVHPFDLPYLTVLKIVFALGGEGADSLYYNYVEDHYGIQIAPETREALDNASNGVIDAASAHEAGRPGASAPRAQARRGTVSRGGQVALARLGLKEVNLTHASYNAGRKLLENAGFQHVETTKTGRQVFVNPKTGARVYYDSGGALVGNQKPHWHITDAGGQGYDRSGRAVDSSSNAGHIPAH
jgi:RHS repeat-associated protein